MLPRLIEAGGLAHQYLVASIILPIFAQHYYAEGVIKVQQLGLFTEEEVRPAEPMTRVSLRRKSAQVPLRARHRQATAKLKEVLTSLEGNDILISYCGKSHSHWWFNDLKLSRLKMD